MIFTIKEEHIRNYRIRIYQSSDCIGYTVDLSKMIDEYTSDQIKGNYYTDEEKANRRYKALIREAKKM